MTTDATDRPSAHTVARNQLMALGLTEWQAIAVLLPVIAEAYREVADDAREGAALDVWGSTPAEALSQFAAAYRARANELDPPTVAEQP